MRTLKGGANGYMTKTCMSPRGERRGPIKRKYDTYVAAEPGIRRQGCPKLMSEWDAMMGYVLKSSEDWLVLMGRGL